MKYILLFTLLFTPSLFANSVVKIISTAQSPDYKSPWNMKSVSNQTFNGVYLGNGKVLATADQLAYYKRIDIQLPQSSVRLPIEVEKIDYELNLVILKASDEKTKGALSTLKPMEFGQEPKFGDSCQALDIGGQQQVQMKTVRFSRPTIIASAYSTYGSIGLRFETTSNQLGGGEPIMCQNKLSGLTQAFYKNEISAINLPIIKFFVKNYNQPDYSGSGHLGIILYNLVSAQKRLYYKAQSFSHGVVVGKIHEHSGFYGKLQRGDIILSVNNVKISNTAKMKHPNWSQVHFNYLLSQKPAGFEVQLKIWRDGKEMNIEGKLVQKNSNRGKVLRYFADYNPADWKLDHLIYGGVVFVELSVPYMYQYGEQWSKFGPSEFVGVIKKDDPLETPTKERHIVAQKVLPTDYTQGYEQFSPAILENVNGKKPMNLAELRDMLSSSQEEFTEFNFRFAGGKIILKKSDLGNINKVLTKKYQIGPNANLIE